MTKILNVMLSAGLGGIQAASVAYGDALARLPDTSVINVVHADTQAAHGVGNARVISPFSAYDPVAALRLARVIHAEKPDLIVSHGKRAGRIVRMANMFVRARHVHVLHRYKFSDLRRYDAVWCLTPDMQSRVQDGITTALVPLWLPADTQIRPARTAPVHTPPVVGFLGRFVPEKGADVLLSALEKLPDVAALLGGDGGERTALEAVYASARIRFAGWVSDTESFWNGIDVLCVPSRWESFGLVVLESMARGVPVVSTPTAGPSSVIVDGVNGIISPPERLHDALHRVLNDGALYATLARGAHETAQAYTQNAALSRLEQAAQSALKIDKNA